MITTFAAAQLAAQRHDDMIDEAITHRQVRIRRAERVHHVQRRGDSVRRVAAQTRSAYRTFYAAAQL